jgi:branched-chain amino acid transport system ATP-binding protein
MVGAIQMLDQGCFTSGGRPPVDKTVEINDLCKISACSPQVRNLSLQIGRGEIVGVLGRPGVRPHIMLDLLSGVVSPTSGSIVFQGEDVTHLRHECRFRRGIAQVLPVSAIIPHFTLLENVLLHGLSRTRPLFPRDGGKTDHDEALALLDFAGLAEHATCYAETLGPQDRWRLTMAIALASRPLLLLLTDCGFGPTVQPAASELIRRISARGTSILLVSRSWHPVMDICHRIEVLREGEVIAASTDANALARREKVSVETARRPAAKVDRVAFRLRRLLKRGWLAGRTQPRSAHGYNRSSDH